MAGPRWKVNRKVNKKEFLRNTDKKKNLYKKALPAEPLQCVAGIKTLRSSVWHIQKCSGGLDEIIVILGN